MKRLCVLNLIILFVVTTNNKANAQQTTTAQNTNVIHLNDDNWRALLEKEWMVEFYAPWCPACRNLADTWEEYAKWGKSIGVRTAQIDVTLSPALSGRFVVTALPTIFHVVNGEFRQYRGGRDLKTLMDFIQEKKWAKIDPVSTWKQPNSFHMSIVSYFFKVSHYLKEFNATLATDYGVPTWGVYILFAITTIVIGAILGLLLVCVIDFIFPPKHGNRLTFADKQELEQLTNKEFDEIGNDDLEDDEGANVNDDDDDDDDDHDDNEDGDDIARDIASLQDIGDENDDEDIDDDEDDDDGGVTSEEEKNSGVDSDEGDIGIKVSEVINEKKDVQVVKNNSEGDKNNTENVKKEILTTDKEETVIKPDNKFGDNPTTVGMRKRKARKE